jgi:hypothetical protein
MSTPFTHEELDNMPYKTIIELANAESPRLHPYCLIGLPFPEFKDKLQKWYKGRGQVEILKSGDASYGDIRVMTWFCDVDQNNIVLKVTSQD